MDGYELRQDPYIDPETGIYRNLLEITDSAELERREGDITYTKSVALAERPVEGNFDLEHLQAIHRFLFEDLYDWAGRLRTVELDRDDTKFASVEHLPTAARGIFGKLAKENFFKNFSDEDYLSSIAHYHSEVNILHPFREGNGRSQRAFFSMFAAQSGRTINWGKMDPERNIEACALAYKGDEGLLVKMFSELISKNNN